MKTVFAIVMCLILGVVCMIGCAKRASAPPGTTGTPYNEVSPTDS